MLGALQRAFTSENAALMQIIVKQLLEFVLRSTRGVIAHVKPLFTKNFPLFQSILFLRYSESESHNNVLHMLRIMAFHSIASHLDAQKKDPASAPVVLSADAAATS
jgi:hypothetical protein